MKKKKDVLANPEHLRTVHRFAQSLSLQGKQIHAALENASKAHRVRSVQDVAFDLATQFRELKLIGLMLQLPSRARLEVLVRDGELSPAEAERALIPITFLDSQPELKVAFAWVLPDWFQSDNDTKSSIAIYCSYVSADESYYRSLKKYISLLKREYQIIEIEGADISDCLDKADVALLLISPDYVVSDLHWNAILSKVSDFHNSGEIRIIPLLVRPVDIAGLAVAHLSPLPRNGGPIATWSNPDLAWMKVSEGIRRVLQRSLRESPPDDEVQPSWHSPVLIYCAAADPDESHVDELVRRSMARSSTDQVKIRSASSILPGDNWFEYESSLLKSADVIVLFFSRSFLNTRFLSEYVLKESIERLRTAASRVVPLLLEPCAWQKIGLSDLQALPSNLLPVSLWEEVDQAWDDVASGMSEVIRTINYDRVAKRTIAQPAELFFACAAGDEFLAREFQAHLMPMIASGARVASPLSILPGDDRHQSILNHLESASLIVILLSANFARNGIPGFDFECVNRRLESGDCAAVFVLVRPFDMFVTQRHRWSMLPQNGTAVTAWIDRDAAWVDVVSSLRALLASSRAGILKNSSQQQKNTTTPEQQQPGNYSPEQQPPGTTSATEQHQGLNKGG